MSGRKGEKFEKLKECVYNNGGKLSRLQLSQKLFSCSILESYIKPRKIILIILLTMKSLTFHFTCADKVYCHDIMNATRRHETPGSETKEWFLFTALLLARVQIYIFALILQAPIPTRKQEGQAISAHSVYLHHRWGIQAKGNSIFVMNYQQKNCWHFTPEGDIILIL